MPAFKDLPVNFDMFAAVLSRSSVVTYRSEVVLLRIRRVLLVSTQQESSEKVTRLESTCTTVATESGCFGFCGQRAAIDQIIPIAKNSSNGTFYRPCTCKAC